VELAKSFAIPATSQDILKKGVRVLDMLTKIFLISAIIEEMIAVLPIFDCFGT